MASPLSGFQAGMLVNNLDYGFAELTINVMTEAIEITNTEGVYLTDASFNAAPETATTYPGVYQGFIDSPSVAELSCTNGALDQDLFPWLTPLLITHNFFAEVKVFPERTDTTVFWFFPCVIFTSVESKIDVKGKQVATWTAKSVGRFLQPGQSGDG